MTDEQILVTLRKAVLGVAPQLEGKLDHITLDARIDGLGLDSVATMEMVGSLEDEVNVVFPDEELAKVTHLAHLAALMRGQRI
jgi:acyl carrier protein